MTLFRAFRYGERRWGEQCTQALETTGYAYQTAVNVKNVAAKVNFNRRRLKLTWAHHAEVAARIELSRRRDKLTWAHHAEVAALEPAEQDRWLDRAERGEEGTPQWLSE